MIELKFEKLYANDRIAEPCNVAVPFGKGVLSDIDLLGVMREGNHYPVQSKATAKWPDGSVKWAFVRFFADLPANKSAVYELVTNAEARCGQKLASADGDSVVIDTGCLKIKLSPGKNLIAGVSANGTEYGADCFEGMILNDGIDTYDVSIDRYEVVENGPLCAIVKGYGSHLSKSGLKVDFEVKFTAFKDKPWVEMAYVIINTTDTPLHVASLEFKFHALKHQDKARACVASSNYATDYVVSDDGERVQKVIDDQLLLYHGNEHMAEVFYGTFSADYTDENGGLCATVFQAQQNYPKAVSADNQGLTVSLVPKGVNEVIMQSGMAREQRILLHFHERNADLKELDDRSTKYQMPDRPVISPEVYKAAGVFEDVFVENKNSTVEESLILRGDNHARCYGMLNWGDSPDPGYSKQGRGAGQSVWTNNEYDFSHACTLMYARTGYRRFLDYMLVSSRHWMDVDVCHYSDDPLVYGGQWEHAPKHCEGSHMACSHEWVAGLLDYYHFTGDEDAFKTALGIANNVVALLDSPQFSSYGALHARETGWALRTLVDMYNETNDEKWLTKCDWIVGHFEQWEQKYGLWLAPYTDNTVIRVTFMIAVAITSLMRYYRIRPLEKIKKMIIRAVDDLIENCRTDEGIFFYKELPSLQKPSNPNILEALAIAYELTGDRAYLEAGIEHFKLVMHEVIPPLDIAKRIEGDAVINEGLGTKSFAQPFLPIVSYYKLISELDMMPML